MRLPFRIDFSNENQSGSYSSKRNWINLVKENKYQVNIPKVGYHSEKRN